MSKSSHCYLLQLNSSNVLTLFAGKSLKFITKSSSLFTITDVHFYMLTTLVRITSSIGNDITAVLSKLYNISV